MSFPKELTALAQWICWRLEPDPKGGKPRKVPYDPKTGSYLGPDGQMVRQTNLVTGGQTQTWKDMLPS